MMTKFFGSRCGSTGTHSAGGAWRRDGRRRRQLSHDCSHGCLGRQVRPRRPLTATCLGRQVRPRRPVTATTID